MQPWRKQPRMKQRALCRWRPSCLSPARLALDVPSLVCDITTECLRLSSLKGWVSRFWRVELTKPRHWHRLWAFSVLAWWKSAGRDRCCALVWQRSYPTSPCFSSHFTDHDLPKLPGQSLCSLSVKSVSTLHSEVLLYVLWSESLGPWFSSVILYLQYRHTR